MRVTEILSDEPSARQRVSDSIRLLAAPIADLAKEIISTRHSLHTQVQGRSYSTFAGETGVIVEFRVTTPVVGDELELVELAARQLYNAIERRASSLEIYDFEDQVKLTKDWRGYPTVVIKYSGDDIAMELGLSGSDAVASWRGLTIGVSP